MSMPRIGRRHSHGEEPRKREQRQQPARPAAAPHRRHAGSNGKKASILCVVAAFLAFGVVLIAEQIAYVREEPANVFLSGFACLFAVAALIAGIYAQLSQARHWSRRVRNRLLVGMPVAALTCVMTLANFFDKPASAEQALDGASSAHISLEPESQELFGPGWYGEGQVNGVEAVVVSYAENAPESRAFNRLLNRRVSFAKMTVSNYGRPQPIMMRSAQVGLLLASGEEVLSLDAKPLLNVTGDTSEALMQRLSDTQTLAVGAMVPDIPICADADFRWERVRAVKLTLDGFTLVVPGRMVTGDEKFTLLMKQPAPPKPAAASTNQSAEAWLKDL